MHDPSDPSDPSESRSDPSGSRSEPAGEHPAGPDAEGDRLADPEARWKRWGPYLAERAWGTVREDYSEAADPWEAFPHEHARSRAYRWSDDGLGGVCDDQQRLCLAFAFWNGRDPILKERIFGLSGNEGNHGEDAKEYWWYGDSTPTHSSMQWHYVYPQAEFPYRRLLEENRARGRHDPELELLDTGVFDDDRYWDITADYAKATPDDLMVRLTVRNMGPEHATLHVLPTLWFRNTWSWGLDDRRPVIVARDGALVAEHHSLGSFALTADGMPDQLFCENETNHPKLWGTPGSTAYPKDGIDDHVVSGLPTVNPADTGTKAAFHYVLEVPAGASATIRLRLAPGPGLAPEPDDVTIDRRRGEADAFYARLLPADTSDEDRLIARQALAGLLWSKQFFHYDVDRWLEGDPAGPVPPASRKRGRNHAWRHLNNHDVVSMPDTWEYPWYAAWDLAFHCVALAHVDAEFAKEQLLLLCREWYMHPNGQLPAYEWSFDDVNPPVHAWAALRVFEIDGSTDHEFLTRIFHKLLLNFTWWVNRKDAEGNNVFEGGFLGLDNIGPIDRSAQLPVDGVLEQSDGTAWMALFCLNMLEIALVLGLHDPAFQDLATKFFEHFAYIASAVDERGMWDEDDGFYYDVIDLGPAGRVPLKVRSMVGVLPLVATTTLDQATLERLPWFDGHLRWFIENKATLSTNCDLTVERDGMVDRLLALVSPDRLDRVLRQVLGTDEMLSPHGVRSLSAMHREHPFSIDLGGMHFGVDYEPAESTTPLFGGNSNWRGPVWFPVNYLVVEALRRFDRFVGPEHRVEFPTGGPECLSLGDVADRLSERLVSLFRDDAEGNRPCFGSVERFQRDPLWHDRLLFHEYFDGDTGAGLGASHQTGWTGLVADLIIRRRPSS